MGITAERTIRGRDKNRAEQEALSTLSDAEQQAIQNDNDIALAKKLIENKEEEKKAAKEAADKRELEAAIAEQTTLLNEIEEEQKKHLQENNIDFSELKERFIKKTLDRMDSRKEEIDKQITLVKNKIQEIENEGELVLQEKDLPNPGAIYDSAAEKSGHLEGASECKGPNVDEKKVEAEIYVDQKSKKKMIRTTNTNSFKMRLISPKGEVIQVHANRGVPLEKENIFFMGESRDVMYTMGEDGQFKQLDPEKDKKKIENLKKQVEKFKKEKEAKKK